MNGWLVDWLRFSRTSAKTRQERLHIVVLSLGGFVFEPGRACKQHSRRCFV